MRFSMPRGEYLEIRPSYEIDLDQQLDIEVDEVIPGLLWLIFWNDVQFPWTFTTKSQANAMAWGCQYGASVMYKKMNPRHL